MTEPNRRDLSTVLSVGFDPSPVPREAYSLVVTEGPDAGLSKPFEPGNQPTFRIGQGAACDLVLSDRAVSRRHVELSFAEQGLLVVDLRSKNGTLLNGVRIREAIAAGGESIRMGETVVHVVRRGRLAQTPVVPVATSFGRVMGASTEMRMLYPLFKRLSEATVPVVIEGETGTGKEALAESLHEMGPRADGPFVVFDCTAVPPSLMEAELLGHERGAFTGASSARPGVFELADKGTLFIDEIGDLELALQAKLLRAVERSEIRRIGGTKTLKVDVRILAATRRDLDREVAAGRFRDDLFHRIAVSRVELPPLRSRRGDVSVLARHFWQSLGGDPQSLAPSLIQQWEDGRWPGNVRELRNTVSRHLALGELATTPAQRPAPPAQASGPMDALVGELLASGLTLQDARDRIVTEFERRYVRAALERSDGNVTHAARTAGIGRRYFQMLKSKLKDGDDQ